jgi:dihydropteroate synthase-like protein
VAEKLLLLTGTLAEPSLRRVMEGIDADEYDWTVRALGVKIAALLTADTILKRLTHTEDADRVLLPGRFRGDLERLAAHFGVPFERGPDELRDLPEFLGQGGQAPDLSRHDMRIFAEIIEAPLLETEAILRRAAQFVSDGADVIDIGCMPEVPFPDLPDVVARLKAEGYTVSVDSLDPEELLAGGRAGADYLLSLTEETLWIVEEVASTPVLLPSKHGDLDSLVRAGDCLSARGRACILDPILDPIHFGFTDAIVRYHTLRQRRPDAALMMGVGNLTELTEADTTGINAMLTGIMSELRIGNLLATQVSPHCRSVVRELDLARRIMYRAREEVGLPKQISGGLSALHERKPFPYGPDEIRAAALEVKDRNFRIQVSREAIHIYNREGYHCASDPFDLYPHLDVEQDGAHAFYLGVELARAQIALQLGKRYSQDNLLDWGCALAPSPEDRTRFAPEGTTKKQRPRSRD